MICVHHHEKRSCITPIRRAKCNESVNEMSLIISKNDRQAARGPRDDENENETGEPAI